MYCLLSHRRIESLRNILSTLNASELETMAPWSSKAYVRPSISALKLALSGFNQQRVAEAGGMYFHDHFL